MRLADIAKELRITTQELRHELAKTNFGISPTAHEVEDALGKGIVRFLKTRVKPTLTGRRVAAVIDKEGNIKEQKQAEPTEEEKAAMEVEAREKEKKAKKAAEEGAAPIPEREERQEVSPVSSGGMPERRTIPKESPGMGNRMGGSLGVSRRIEVSKGPAVRPVQPLPHTYYKSGKKKHGRKGGQSEDAVLAVLRRHPESGGRKHQVARVRHEGGDESEGVTAEELSIEKQLDRERFREQKKFRAVGQKKGHKLQPQIKAKTGVVPLSDVMPLKEFAEKTGLPVAEVIIQLAKNGIMATINQKIDFDTAAIVAGEMGVNVVKIQQEAKIEDIFAGDLEKLLKEDDPSLLIHRPPVVSVMGHVDHGKTKILDTIRNANVVAGEAGGITQHIGAYQVEKNGHKITFLDTPGHEAFTAMRARGARATDIAILVVAADEGVKPQTIEAIHHAQEAGIPIIVAINKIDKPDINLDRVKSELTEHGLQPEEWGGKTIMVPVSAITGQGIDKLLEMILLLAELESLKANPKRAAVGTVIESNLDPSMGPVATILINTGTLRVGDSVVVGAIHGKIKTMRDHTGTKVKMAEPSAAVMISGLSHVPQVGDIVQVFKSEQVAKRRAEELSELKKERDRALAGSMVERIVAQINTGKMSFLKIVLKADTQGSLEAIMQELAKIKTKDVAIKVIHYGIGHISVNDILMASASQGLVIGFNADAGSNVKSVADKEHVDIRTYDIIYRLIDDLKSILSGMLGFEETTVELGKLKILKIFLNKKSWAIVGCQVTEGHVEKGATVRVLHEGNKLYETKIESLKHINQEVSLMEKGGECGIKINTPKEIAEGDTMEAYRVDRKERTLN